MYIPQHFREGRLDVLHALVREQSFATLVSHVEGELVATHLPLLLDAECGPNGTLLGHMARANPQWRGFTGGAEALAIFQGPHAYVSPSWYEAQPAVPTWNYVAVHACGAPRLIEDRAALRRLLEVTVGIYEAPQPAPWVLPESDEFFERLALGIVGFELPIARIEGKWKLNQNRSAADRQGVIERLREQDDPLTVAVARLMEEQEL